MDLRACWLLLLLVNLLGALPCRAPPSPPLLMTSSSSSSPLFSPECDRLVWNFLGRGFCPESRAFDGLFPSCKPVLHVPLYSDGYLGRALRPPPRSPCFSQGNHTVEGGGKVAFIAGDEFHRAHSGSKGGRASNNAGPLIDLALLSEAPVRRSRGYGRRVFCAECDTTVPLCSCAWYFRPGGRLARECKVLGTSVQFFDDLHFSFSAPTTVAAQYC